MQNIITYLNQVNISDYNTQFLAVIIFLCFFLFRKIFAIIVLKILFLFTKNKEKIKECKAFKIISYFFIFLGLYCAIRVFNLAPEVLEKVNHYFKIICIIFITQTINSFITKDARWVKRYLKRSKSNDVVGNFFCRVVKFIVWIIAGYIIMKELNYDLTGLVAGFGIGGVIISLAAQDTVKSLLSGAVILTDKPFDIGDFIEVGNYKGTVIDMTFRSTRIKAIDNSIITIPNATITSEYVVNWNKLKSRRLEFILGLNMNTTSDKIKNIVKKIRFVLKNNPDVLPDTVQVSLDAIADYSANIKVFLYINVKDYIQFLNIKQKIYCDILELLEKENVDLAYPTQTVYVKNEQTEKADLEEQKIQELIGEEDEMIAMKMLVEEELNKKNE